MRLVLPGEASVSDLPLFSKIDMCLSSRSFLENVEWFLDEVD